MKILHLIPDIKLGCGLSNSVFTASQAMVMKGHEVAVSSELIDDYYKGKFAEIGVEWFYAPLLQTHKTPGRFYDNFVTLRLLVKKLNVDIVHSHHRWNALIAHFAVGKRARHVTSDHNVLYGNKFMSFKAERVITDSLFNKKHLMSYFGVPEEKIDIVPPLIEFNRFSRLKDMSDEIIPDKTMESYLESGTINIGQIARLSEQKGQSFLIDAVKEINKKNDKIRFFILGDGPLKSELQYKIDRLGLEKVIHILPLMKDITPFLSQMDFMVYSSKHEGFCAAVSESLLAGKPVIGTTTGGIPEQVFNGENGYLYDYGEEEVLCGLVLKLAEDEALRLKMVEKSRALFLKNFGHEVISERLEKAYLEN